MVHELVEGIHHFRKQVFRQHRELFERLAQKQAPETLFITCSDSRIDPNLITHTEPGDLFVLRNAGNLVPAYGATSGGEVATIEFAVTGLKVKDIIVCGHSHCGAMKGLLKPEYLAEMPAVSEWLRHAEVTRRIVRSKYKHLTGDDLLEITTEENVLAQIENLQTHPAVAVALAHEELKLHGWIYDIASGDVFAYDEPSARFVPLNQWRPAASAPPQRIVDVNSGDAKFGEASGST